jgi:hypothetical protein
LSSNLKGTLAGLPVTWTEHLDVDEATTRPQADWDLAETVRRHREGQRQEGVVAAIRFRLSHKLLAARGLQVARTRAVVPLNRDQPQPQAAAPHKETPLQEG